MIKQQFNVNTLKNFSNQEFFAGYHWTKNCKALAWFYVKKHKITEHFYPLEITRLALF